MSVIPAQDTRLEPAGRIQFWPQWLAPSQAEALLQCTIEELNWRQLPVRMFGRWIPQPRLVDFHADPGVSYTYAGLRLSGHGWPEWLDQLRCAVAEVAGVEFNSVLCNLYRDGRDYMGWHADDETELGLNPCIASISLGASRRFVLRPKGKQCEPAQRHEYRLDSGSLMLMAGDLQHRWQHQLPKALRVKEHRVNLTFRRIMSA